MTDLDKLITGKGGEVLPIDPTKTVNDTVELADDIAGAIGDFAAQIGDFLNTMIPLFLPQQKKVFRTKEYKVTIPAEKTMHAKKRLQDVANPEWKIWYNEWQTARNEAIAQYEGRRDSGLEAALIGVDALYKQRQPPRTIKELITEYEEVVTIPEHQETRYDRVEDSGRSVLLSSWHAFKVWSSIPILQLVAVAAIGVPIAAGFAATIPAIGQVAAQKLLPTSSEVIDIVARR